MRLCLFSMLEEVLLLVSPHFSCSLQPVHPHSQLNFSFFNEVGCTETCNCSSCGNTFGRKSSKASTHMFITGEESSAAAADLPPSLALTLDRLNRSPRKSAGSRRNIEHYNPPNPNSTKPKSTVASLELQKEANFNAATANLLRVKQMLLQSRHKLIDLEAAFEEMEDSGVKKARLDRQTKVVREVVSHIRELEEAVEAMEADITEKYTNYTNVVQI